MNSILRNRDAFGYFRMGLVTGIVDRPDLVEWADRQILGSDDGVEHEIIELSLVGRRPYSQIIRLLTEFEGKARYGLPLKLLFARAGLLLEESPGRAGDLIMGLRLLNEEEYFPKNLRARIADLRRSLDLQRQDEISADELAARLTGFLEPYRRHRDLLRRTVCPMSGVDRESASP